MGKSTQRVGMAGEFHVMSALYRLEHEPCLTLGNAKGIDIIVEVDDRFIKIDVKTIQSAHNWPICALGHDLSKDTDKFYLLLDFKEIENLASQPEVYVVPAMHLVGRVRPWQNSRLAVYKKDEYAWMQKYRDRWDLLKTDPTMIYSEFPEPEYIFEYLCLHDQGGNPEVEVTVQFHGKDWTDIERPKIPPVKVSGEVFHFLERKYMGGERGLMAFDGHPYKVRSIKRQGNKAMIDAIYPSQDDISDIGGAWKDADLLNLMSA